jgi:hypothetical protein
MVFDNKLLATSCWLLARKPRSTLREATKTAGICANLGCDGMALSKSFEILIGVQGERCIEIG